MTSQISLDRDNGVMFTREGTIILNVGGIKYETYPSTLTAFPDTLLGTMFQERNREMLHPKNGNEFFIDRNGYAFRYILEYYRNGKILWSDRADKNLVAVTREELDQEIDYFQIPVKDIAVTSGELAVASKVDAFVAALKEVIHLAIDQLQTEIHMAITDFGTIEEFDWYPAQGQSEIIADIMKPFNMVGFVILQHFGDAIERHIKSEIPEFSWRCEFYNCKPRRGYGALMSPYQTHNHSFLNNSFNNNGFNGISRMVQPNMMTFQHIINANNNTSAVSSWPVLGSVFNQNNNNNNQQSNLNNVAADVNGVTRLFGNNVNGFNSNSVSQAGGGQGINFGANQLGGVQASNFSSNQLGGGQANNFGASQTPIGFGANQADGNVQPFGRNPNGNGPNFNGNQPAVDGQQFGNTTSVNGQAPGPPPPFGGNQATGNGPTVNGPSLGHPFIGGGNQTTGNGTPFGSNQLTGNGPSLTSPFGDGGNHSTGNGPFVGGSNNHFGNISQFGTTFNGNQANNSGNGHFSGNQPGFGFGTTFINQTQGYGPHTITGFAGGSSNFFNGVPLGVTFRTNNNSVTSTQPSSMQGFSYPTTQSSLFGNQHTVSYNNGGQTYVPLHAGHHAFAPMATHDNDAPSMFLRRAEGRALKLLIRLDYDYSVANILSNTCLAK
ncbi:4_t:CDS:2 [Funneliformis caledonium]|uniref:4_t:CDS:1 n=1 Tax=Funneliformis caledonium TaxID=1117310 RepID=A0A9N9CQE8_9GLOM|nr:4_t:CDS:2 [Funneliformis caledonium]